MTNNESKVGIQCLTLKNDQSISAFAEMRRTYDRHKTANWQKSNKPA